MCFFWCFFFKQKTAYEMRISDWSSDVCSSDLQAAHPVPQRIAGDRRQNRHPQRYARKPEPGIGIVVDRFGEQADRDQRQRLRPGHDADQQVPVVRGNMIEAGETPALANRDWKRVVEGKGVTGPVYSGGPVILKNKTQRVTNQTATE